MNDRNFQIAQRIYDNMLPEDDYEETSTPDPEQWHPAIIDYWKYRGEPDFDTWIVKQDVAEINAIICEYTDTTKIVRLLIERKCYEIMTDEVGNIPDWEYFNYLVSIATIDGYNFVCNYESYENWKTDIKGDK